jgi:hypothetical protein
MVEDVEGFGAELDTAEFAEPLYGRVLDRGDV